MSNRNFNVSESIVIEKANEVNEYLNEDLSRFTSFDLDLNARKQQQLTAKIAQVLSIGNFSSQQAEVKSKTDTLLGQMQQCHQQVETLKYFVNKAFKSNPVIIRQFKFREYTKVRNNQPKLIVYMFGLAETIAKHKDSLLAAGMPQDDIDAVRASAETLQQANTQQETGKNESVANIDERNNLLNEIYSILKDFNLAAKIVFAGNPVHCQRYDLPIRATGSAVVDEDENVEGDE